MLVIKIIWTNLIYFLFFITNAANFEAIIQYISTFRIWIFWTCSWANLPITRRVKPIPRKEKALRDLCFLKPKHKLITPKIAETIKSSHSNSSVASIDKPKIGSNVTINGQSNTLTINVSNYPGFIQNNDSTKTNIII